MNSNSIPPNTSQRVTHVLRQNKRPATNMSSDAPLPSSDSVSPDVSNHQSPNHAPYNGFIHHIKPTFLGPICTACQRKVANGNILFDISRNSIKKHLTTNKCYIGDIEMFQARELEKTLHMSTIHHYDSMRDNPTIASRVVEQKFNFVPATQNFPYCAKCGFISSKLCHIRRHAKHHSNQCSESDVRSADGSIMTNEYGFLIPLIVLRRIRNGTFIPPSKRGRCSNRVTRQPTNTPNTPSVSMIRYQTITTPSPTTQMLPTLQSPITNNASIDPADFQFLPSDGEIMTAVSNNSPYKDAVSLNSFAMSELTNTFATKDQSDSAYEYLTLYTLLINQQKPGLLRRTLTEYTNNMKPNVINTTLRLLVLSGKLWLESNAANMDVRMVPVHHRNSIYLIGNTHTDNDKDLLKGGTFVWSDNVDIIVDQFASLISFAFETKWPKMDAFLEKVQQVYMIALEDPNNISEDEYTVASAKIVDTTIIFGLLTEIMLEHPDIPNGPNLIYKYLAGCTVRKNHDGSIILRNPNEISKHANALLRLLRHGVCSMYIRRSQLMVQQNESHKTFEVWANSLIRQMQVCPSIGHICRTIRTAREVDRKTPSLVRKAFNDITGELLVGGVHINKSTWSVAIPTAIAEWDRHLFYIFPNHSQKSNLSLHHLFDLTNDIVLADQDSYLNIGGTESQSIPLSEFKPTIPM